MFFFALQLQHKLRYLCFVSASKLQMNAAQLSSMKLKRLCVRCYVCVHYVAGQCASLLLVYKLQTANVSAINISCSVEVSVCSFVFMSVCVCGFV